MKRCTIYFVELEDACGDSRRKHFKSKQKAFSFARFNGQSFWQVHRLSQLGVGMRKGYHHRTNKKAHTTYYYSDGGKLVAGNTAGRSLAATMDYLRRMIDHASPSTNPR